MPWGVAAGAAISAGVGLYSASKQSKAVEASSRLGAEVQRSMYDNMREDLDPFKWAGQTAVRRLENLSGAQGAGAAREAFQDFVESPGYQFRVDEGTRAILNNASASGAAGGGNVLRALVDYGQGQASQEFGNYYNRLFGLAQLGGNAAAQSGQAGITTGQGIASNALATGAAQSQIIGNTAQGISTVANNALSNIRWNQLYAPQGGGGGGFGTVTTSGFGSADMGGFRY